MRRPTSRTRKRNERDPAPITIEARSAVEAGSASSRVRSTASRLARWGEGVLDWVDSMHRTHTSRKILDDLVAYRISHGRASIEQRKLVGRIKGEALRLERAAASGGSPRRMATAPVMTFSRSITRDANGSSR